MFTKPVALWLLLIVDMFHGLVIEHTVGTILKFRVSFTSGSLAETLNETFSP